jgi:amino acid adenylation domain-containing protein
MRETTRASATVEERPPVSVRWTEPLNAYVPFAPEFLLKPLDRCFEEQARRHAARPALKDHDRVFPYDALNRAANRVAHCLLAQRSDATAPVAIFAENGACAVIAVLASLKSGRPYVRLDPASPRERIVCTLQDAQASAVLASGRHIVQAREFAGPALPVIDVDDPGSGLAEEDPRLDLRPDTIAAIVYTSGSTGQPKGVMFTHNSMMRPIAQATADFHLCAADRVGLIVPYGLSVAVPHIFGALLNGGLLLPFDVRAEGFTHLAAWLRQEEVTVLHWVATAFRTFARTLQAGEIFPSVRLLSLGGETVLRRDVDLYKRHFPKDCLLRLGMGCTEACATIARVLVDQTTEIAGDVMPVGYAVEGAEILLLDEEGGKVSPGCVGEIAIKSAHLSPGYWRRPDLTLRAFQPASEDGARLYRTGDLGRIAADGCVWHLGRKDLQVKVQGHRIELSEVEAALLRLPGISEAVAVARDDATGNQRIVAYIVSRESPAPTAGRIRTALAAVLPGYMIPSSFVFLDAMPLTPNGKLDRAKLPSPSLDRPPLEGECRAPRTGVEARLAHIWEDILSVRPIGVTDNFFDLGGNSLAIASLCAAVEEKFGFTLPPVELFKTPTVEGLAGLLDDAPVATRETSLLAFRQTGAHPPLFCLDTLNAGSFVHLARHLGPSQPCYGLQPFGFDGKRVTVESLAEYYVRRVRAVQPGGPYYLCGMCGGGVVAYEMAQQLLVVGERVAWLALFDAYTPARSALPLALQRMIRRWKERGERRAQRSTDGTRSRMLTTRHLLLLRRYEHRNRRVMSRAMVLYRPQPYPGRLHLFLAEQRRAREGRDSRLVWDELARGGAETFAVPGVHEKMLVEPHVAILADHVRRCLQEARHEAR